MKKKFIILVMALVLVTGCNSSKNNVTNQSLNYTQTIKSSSNKKDNKQAVIKKEESLTPKWILNPNKENQICSVGQAKMSNLATAKKIAFITAKARISEQIKVSIQSESTISKNCTSEECKKSYSSKIRQQSTNMLRNIKTVDTYQDKKSNLLYVHACTY